MEGLIHGGAYVRNFTGMSWQSEVSRNATSPPPPLPLGPTPLSQLHALYFKPGFTEREIRGGERGRERGREREGERERGGELAVYS